MVILTTSSIPRRLEMEEGAGAGGTQTGMRVE